MPTETKTKQTEEIVRSMAEGVIMVNQKGEVLLMNPAAERLLNAKGYFYKELSTHNELFYLFKKSLL